MNTTQLTEYDRQFYAEKIEPWLPGAIWDCHVHVYKKEFDHTAAEKKTDWMYRMACENTEVQLLDVYQSCFPGKQVQATIFGMPAPQVDIGASNAYVADVAERQGWEKLALVHPGMDRKTLEQVCRGFSGIKVYLSFAAACIPRGEIRIFDFLTRPMLEYCDENRHIVMLHIPRAARLRDPLNLAQMLEIEEKYPNLKLIIAHVGRAYCAEDIGDVFELLKDTRRMRFDISANTSTEAFDALLSAIPPSRILFGTDLPILAMRSGRTTENGTYYNLVPSGLYGNLAGVPNMRECAPNAPVTLLMYEGIAAFLQVCREKGVPQGDVDDIFYNNAARLWGREGES